MFDLPFLWKGFLDGKHPISQCFQAFLEMLKAEQKSGKKIFPLEMQRPSSKCARWVDYLANTPCPRYTNHRVNSKSGKTHLYNSRLSKVKWFVNRFGAREVLMKPLRVTFAPLIIPRLPRNSFVFHGKSLPYFFHGYNMTWAGERCVEVPIAFNYLEQAAGKNILEVGNVLSHYRETTHDILDKFEKGRGVINEDILTFAPAKKYDLVLSISTFEHIGFDDEADEPSGKKILAAIAACRKLLSPSGRLIITVPLGYNPDLDQLVASGGLDVSAESFLRRTGFSEWQECTKGEAIKSKYKTPFPYANGIMVAEFSC
jgi:SAM-dependent methyltransferase